MIETSVLGFTFVNLTPHDIKVLGAGGVITTFPPSGQVARVETIETPTKEAGFFPASTRKFGDVTGVPAPVTNTFYIVSSMVLGAADRKDLIAPDTGSSAARNEKGHVQHVLGFIRNR